MTPLIRKFKSLSYREIYWRLRKQEMPEASIEETITALRADRELMRQQKLAKRAADTAWGEVLEALQHERRIVRTMVRYKTATPAPERDEFVRSYNDVLVKTYAKLCLLRKRGGMPEHTHWTDYVPANIKQAFIDAAAEIPSRTRAKIKQPFERTDPYDLHDRRKGRLLRRTRNELKTAEDVGDEAKAEQIRTAIEVIKELPPSAHLPNTWHGVLKGE